MRRLHSLAVGGLLMGLGACFVACGGDDAATQAAGGSAGTGGNSGSGGNAGSTSRGGASGSAGKGGAAGSAQGGSGGSAGQGGSGGTGGTLDASGDAPTADAPSTDAPTTETSPGDAPQDGARADTSQDAPPPSDATSDATSTDSTDATRADATDAGSTPEAGPDSPASSCPVSQPVNDTSCPSGQTPCDYGDGSVTCICHVVSAGIRNWNCTDADAAAGGASCPMMKPKPDDAGQYGSCTDGGASFSCRYGNTWCFCNEGLSMNSIWSCL
jgi:hypothetical protein